MRNFETNLSKSPIKPNETSALFVHLAEASIYQVEFNMSKAKPPKINQTTHYFIETGQYFLHFSKQNFLLDLEDLNFSCQLNETNEQIAFYWSNLTSPGYKNSNLTIALAIDKNKIRWTTPCDPYRSQGNCSTEGYKLEPGTAYQISVKLEKNFTNSSKQKLGNCSIKTSRNIDSHSNVALFFRSQSYPGGYY